MRFGKTGVWAGHKEPVIKNPDTMDKISKFVKRESYGYDRIKK
jgi:hypothetical protein